MFTIALCDDQERERIDFRKLLDNYFKEVDIGYIAYEYDSGKKLIEECEEGGRVFDLIFMDIFMDGINGFEAAKKIRRMDKYVPIAFLTNSMDFAIESYEVEAIGYLVKPVNTKRLYGLLEKLTRSETVKSLEFRKKGHVRYYNYRDIVYIESHGHVVTLHLADGDEVGSYYKLDDLYLDDERFLRCHKSYLVNMDYVKYIENDFVMTDGSTVPVRVHSRKEIADIYTNYFVKKQLGEMGK